MRDGFRIIDCDRHVMEPADMWERYLDRPFRHYVGWLVQATDTIGARINDATWRGAFSYAISRGFDRQAYLDDLDREGIDVAVLFSTAGLGFCWYDDLDPECSAALCRAYNNWLYDYCAIDPDRLFGMMLLPLQDVELAQKELRRATQELRCVAGLILPNPVIGRRLHDGAYDVLYREAETLGVPLVVSHGGSGMVLPQVGQDRWPAFYAREVAVDTFEAWIAVASFMGHNVLERFPRLHVGFIGAGCGWLPYWLERLEEHWGGFFGQDSVSTQAPDRVFRAQGFAACDPWERTLPEVVEAMGERAVVWGSQYPLPDILHFFPNELQSIVEDRHLTEEAKRRTLWDNAADLFHIGAGHRS